MFDFPVIRSTKSLDPFFNIPNAHNTTIGNVIVLSYHILFVSISKSFYFANFSYCFTEIFRSAGTDISIRKQVFVSDLW